jgi:plasmid stabilization system protein ParE
MSRLLFRACVEDDIHDLAAYLLDQSKEAAQRFVDAVQATLKHLAATPGIGSPKQFRNRKLVNVRSWWDSGFPNYLIYYVPLDDNEGIDVYAVLHGARDVERVLSERT